MKSQFQNKRPLLAKFKNIFKKTNEILQSEVASKLGITERELSLKLFEWNDFFPFKIDGDMIVVEDISTFISAVDKKFVEWETKEKLKDGKLE
jgi:hypothetical protein